MGGPGGTRDGLRPDQDRRLTPRETMDRVGPRSITPVSRTPLGGPRGHDVRDRGEACAGGGTYSRCMALSNSCGSSGAATRPVLARTDRMPVVHPIIVIPSGTTAADMPRNEPARLRAAPVNRTEPRLAGGVPVATKDLDAHHGPMQPPGAARRRGRMLVVRLLLLVACALVAGCGPGSAASPPTNPSPVVSFAGGPPSVTGTVTAGPVCPVEQYPPDPRCAARPVAGAVIVATDSSGQEVGRATSAADGSYLVDRGSRRARCSSRHCRSPDSPGCRHR